LANLLTVKVVGSVGKYDRAVEVGALCFGIAGDERRRLGIGSDKCAHGMG
jgi:hypothetical protein